MLKHLVNQSAVIGKKNYLHWVSDIDFREDDCRIGKDNAPQNFATIRHISFNLLIIKKIPKLEQRISDFELVG